MIHGLRLIFTGVMARIFLKEPFGIFEAILVTVALIGITFVLQPPFLFSTYQAAADTGHFNVSVIVFLGTMVASVVGVCNRKLVVKF